MAELTGSGDVYVKVTAGDYDGAKATRRRLEDAMRLLNDLGWDPEESGEVFELTMPSEDLARALRLLNDRAPRGPARAGWSSRSTRSACWPESPTASQTKSSRPERTSG